LAKNNAISITITGDESDLTKALQRAAKDINAFGGDVGKQGQNTGKGFGDGFGNGAKGGLRLVASEFQNIQTAASGGFAGIASSFLSLVVNPITLGLAGLGIAVAGAFKFALIGEENAKIAKSFKTFATDAGLDAEDLKEKISAIAEGFVDLEEVLPRAGTAVLALGKNAAKLPEIFQLARTIGVTTGRDINDTFDTLTKGIENGNEKLLRANGIRVDGKKVLEDFAKANGTVVEALTDAGRQQAFLNAVLEKGSEKFKDQNAQAEPLKGGIKQLELAFDDLSDGLAAIINSGVGKFFADVVGGAAIATKAVAGFFTPDKTGPSTIREEMAKIKEQMDEVKQSKLDNPNFAEGYNRQLNELNNKLRTLQNVQKAVDDATKESNKLKSEDIIDPEVEKKANEKKIEDRRLLAAEIQAIEAEEYALKEQAETEHSLRMMEIEAGGAATSLEIRDAKLASEIEKNELTYQSELAKNEKIKNAKQKAAADELALTKKLVADQKAADDKSVKDAQLTADAKLLIENNLFAAAKLLVDQQSALGKGIAITQGIINTYRGATLALATYPPPFGAVAAASTVALGLVQVAKIAGANQGALVTGGINGSVDTEPFMLSKGEIVAPAKSYENVIQGEIAARGYQKNDSNMNDLLSQILEKLDNRSVSITINTDVVADENGINKLAEKLRDAIAFNSAPALG
jgi:hypothetical protein